MFGTYGYTLRATFPAGLRALIHAIFQTGSRSSSGPGHVTNAFIGKPEEPYSVSGWNPAPLRNRP